MGTETASAHIWVRIQKEFQGRGEKDKPQASCLNQKNPDKRLRESEKGKKAPKAPQPHLSLPQTATLGTKEFAGDVFPVLMDGIFQAVINWTPPLWADLWSSSSLKAFGLGEGVKEGSSSSEHPHLSRCAQGLQVMGREGGRPGAALPCKISPPQLFQEFQWFPGAPDAHRREKLAEHYEKKKGKERRWGWKEKLRCSGWRRQEEPAQHRRVRVAECHSHVL